MKIANIFQSLVLAGTICSCTAHYSELFHRSKLEGEKTESKDEETHIVIRLKTPEPNLDLDEKSLSQLEEDQLIPNQEVIGSNGQIATGVYYRLVNKLRSEQNTPSFLAYDDVGALYRSDEDSDNTLWALSQSTNTDYTMLCKYQNSNYKSYIYAAAYIDQKYTTLSMACDIRNFSLWSLSLNQNMYYRIANKFHSDINAPAFIDTIQGNVNLNACRSNDSSDSTLWRLIPCGYTLKVKIDSFHYDDIIYDLSKYAKKDLGAVVGEASNYSPSGPDNIQEIKVNKKEENHSLFSFSSSTERTFYDKLDVGISADFFGMGGHVENTAEWSNKEATLSKVKQVNMKSTDVTLTYTVQVPPRKKERVVFSWFTVDIDVPFTAKVHIQGLADRVLMNGVKAMNKYVGPSAIKSFLINEGYNVQNIIACDENSAIATITGLVKIQGATGYIIEKREEDLPSDQIDLSGNCNFR